MSNLEILDGITELQCQNGTWNFNVYQFGLANGLILALAVIKGEEPKLLDAPDEWLEDTSEITPEDIVQHDIVDGKQRLLVAGKAIHLKSENVCMHCGEKMTKARFETSEGDWILAWLCSCKSE